MSAVSMGGNEIWNATRLSSTIHQRESKRLEWKEGRSQAVAELGVILFDKERPCRSKG
jgi:hypothetical protein